MRLLSSGSERQGQRDDGGFAMIVVLIIITIASLLAVTLLSQGEHLDRATFRDRKWHTALQVAESGVDRTISRLTDSFTFAGYTTAQAVPGGQFETIVENGDSLGLGLGRKKITSTAYIPSKGHANEVRRRVRVVIGPPPVLKYALFGSNCLTINNGGAPIVGDVFSNGHVVIENGTLVDGNVTSSRGVVRLNPNAEVRKFGGLGGNVRSGGKPGDASCGPTVPSSGTWGIQVENNSIIHGNASAERATGCPSPADTLYGIDGGNGSKIFGDAKAWGAISAQIAVSGTKSSNVCQAAADIQVLPRYAAYDPSKAAWAATDYYNVDFYAAVAPGVTLTRHATVADFLTYMNSPVNRNDLKGIHLIRQTAGDASTTIDMSGTTITDHFVLVSPSRIRRGNSLSSVRFFNNGGSDKKTVQLVSLVAPGSLGVEIDDNSLTFNGVPCMLVYSTGRVVMKNNAVMFGAVYGQHVELNNGFQVKYDKCIESSLAFGDELAEVKNFFNELTPFP